MAIVIVYFNVFSKRSNEKASKLAVIAVTSKKEIDGKDDHAKALSCLIPTCKKKIIMEVRGASEMS